MKKRADHGGRFGHPGGFDEQIVDIGKLLCKFEQHLFIFIGDSAADTTILQLEKLAGIHSPDQVGIDAHLPEFILHEGKMAVGIKGKDMVDQGGLSRTQESGDDGCPDFLICHISTPPLISGS